MDDHQFATDDFEIVGELADARAQNVLKKVSTSHELVDQASCGQSMHHPELAQNGTECVTKGWRD